MQNHIHTGVKPYKCIKAAVSLLTQLFVLSCKTELSCGVSKIIIADKMGKCDL